MRTLLFAAAAATVLGLALTDRAGACSCAVVDARERLPAADAAVIGTIVDAGDPATLRVEEAVKGDLPAEIRLPHEGDGGTCGAMYEEGERVGLFLRHAADSGWSAGLCDKVDPDELRRAATPPPLPVGRGRALVLHVGSVDGHRMVARDGRGRPLAYGKGWGIAAFAAVCPGSRRVVEWAVTEARDRVELAVRRLRDLAIVRREPMRRRYEVEGLTCRDRAGRHVVANLYGRDELHHVVRLRPGRRPERLRIIGYDNHGVPSFAGDVAYFNDGAQERDLVRLDLRTGRERVVARTPPTGTRWVPNPAGTHLGGVDFDAPAPMRVLVVDLRSGKVRAAPLEGRASVGGVAWLDDRRLVHGGRGRRATFFDARLRPVARTQRRLGGVPVRAGTRVFALTRTQLRVLDQDEARIRTLVRLPSSSFGQLVAVPGGAPIRLGRSAQRAHVLALARASLFG